MECYSAATYLFMQVLLAVVEDLYIFATSVLVPWRRAGKRQHEELYLSASRVVSPFRAPVAVEVRREEERVLSGEAGDTSAEDEDEKESAVLQRAGDVQPTFVVGVEHSARDAATVRLRLVIRDEFSTILSQLPLQAHEYVYYKLLRRGARIVWPDVRPRTPGSWAKILSHVEGVTVGDVPTIGSVMEFTLADGRAEGKADAKAHLAYVEKVFSDQSIQVSEADWPARGIYNERVLALDEWRVLNPMFITVNTIN